MSGGKRIDDHSFWAGSKPSGSVLPMGSKMKAEKDSAGDGHEPYYEDTTEAIRLGLEAKRTYAKAGIRVVVVPPHMTPKERAEFILEKLSHPE